MRIFLFSVFMSATVFAKSQPRLSVHQIFKNSSGDLSGDIFLLPQSGNFLLDDDELFRPTRHLTSQITINGKTIKIPAHPITTHGFAWNYDVEIPILFHDPKGKYIKKGVYEQVVIQQDVPVTISEILNMAPPSRANGRVLSEILQKNRQGRPKVIMVFAMDQVGRNYLERHKAQFTFLNQLIKDSAFMDRAQVGHVDVETVVGHVALGSGAFPGNSGVASNNFFNPGLNLAGRIFSLDVGTEFKSGGFPLTYFAPTVGDQWMYITNGKAVNFAISAAARAAIGMGGHGRMYRGSFPSNVIYMEDVGESDAAYTTDKNFYDLPESVKDKKLSAYFEKYATTHKGMHLDHPLFKDKGKPDMRVATMTSLISEIERDIILDSVDELKIGKDSITDLMWMNIKATDYCGHAYGHESDECNEAAKAADDEIKAVYDRINAITDGDFVLAISADHGVAPLPELSGGIRFSRQKIVKDLNQKFGDIGPGGEVVLQLASSQLYLNKPLLKRMGHTVNDVVKYLQQYEVEMSAPGNVLANDWIAKGKSKRSKFFKEVVSRESLK